MKQIIKSVYLTLLFATFSLSSFSQAGSVSINQYYEGGGFFTIVTIDIKEAKAVRINYSIDIPQEADNLLFYDVNSSGTQSGPYAYPTGYTTGTYITSTKTGKAVIKLATEISGIKRIDLQYSADNSISTSSDLSVGGNAIINGKLGIGTGTTAPQTKLDVRGDIQLRNSDKIGCSVLTDQFQYDNKYSGNYSISWVSDSWTSTGTTMWQSAWGGMKFFTNGTPRLSITNAGKVGIGTSAPDEFLTVKGKIHAEEVIVDLNVPVADYVFGKEYKLMPLHKVEEYVNANSHLPEVPSAAEIKEKGLSMGEMQNKLLQKVEELTLYVIQQQKEIDGLKKQLGKTPNP